MLQSLDRDAHNAEPCPLNGDEYLRSLDDGREVWIQGRRVGRLTEHAAFRNTARMVARFYDALHARRDCLTEPTERGGHSHRFFRAPAEVSQQLAARDAIADCQRIGYGWLARMPDFEGAFLGVLGANATFYGGYEDNARRWYHKAQQRTWYFQHAGVDASGGGVRVVKETDAGLFVSGAKMGAANAALTHYTRVTPGSTAPRDDPRQAPAFFVPTNAPGVKVICRGSDEQRAAMLGGPFDYPLSSRLDENEAVIVFDNVFVPWEDVLLHGDAERLARFPSAADCAARAALHSCTRLAVKLDFMCGLLAKALEIAGTAGLPNLQARLGEVVAWRNTFWALSDAMAHGGKVCNGIVQPDARAAAAFPVMAQIAYPTIRRIIEAGVASGLIYLNSHACDFKSETLRPLLDRYLRGSGGIGSEQRVKTMKLLWDAIGTEFGGRQALHEGHHMGTEDGTRQGALAAVQRNGEMDAMKAQVERCMAEYDLDGWTVRDLIAPDDVSLLGRGVRSAPAGA